jgi:hypothetical protein
MTARWQYFLGKARKKRVALLLQTSGGSEREGGNRQFSHPSIASEVNRKKNDDDHCCNSIRSLYLSALLSSLFSKRSTASFHPLVVGGGGGGSGDGCQPEPPTTTKVFDLYLTRTTIHGHEWEERKKERDGPTIVCQCHTGCASSF